jgi:uncharacterized membrane protein YfcA
MPDLLLVILVFLCASLVHAVAGFGAGLVAMSLLVLQWPVVQAIGVCSICALMLNLWMALSLRADIQWEELRPMVLATFVGVPVGVMMLHSLPEGWIIGGLGAVLVVHSARSLTRGEGEVLSVSTRWGYVAGLFGGMLGGAFNTSGPPVIVYATARGWPKDRFRATLQIYFLVTGMLAVVLFVVSGVITGSSLGWAVIAIPVMALGFALGQLVVARVSPERFRVLVFIGLGLMGVYYLWRALNAG